VNLLGFLAAAIAAVTVHEYAHARAALHVGDHTARVFGRLSLNPIRHVHPAWSIAVPLALAWLTHGTWIVAGGRPVPVDPTLAREDRFLVYGAGIAANLAVGLCAHALGLYTFAAVNAAMALTNLVPLPGLDGWHLVRTLRSPR
jgi:Zn-dependent protease